MTGFRGQKFDFTGEDGGWYVLISDLPAMHLNMRVTAPVPHLPEITYITGLSLIAADAEGVDHSIAIFVGSPQSLDSSCPSGMPTCLADGALSVIIDGEDALAKPGTAVPGPGVGISAVNLPGACRSFGFEKYWERKKLEGIRVSQASSHESQNVDESVAESPRGTSDLGMSEWVLGDPTVTNMMECAAYVSKSVDTDGGLFAHQSEHSSFKISTPTATVRVSHGRLHQIAMRDPTDQYDLPDHLTWQMNLAIDHNEISRHATGIMGETIVPTVDANGKAIMNGMEAIRGTQESCEYCSEFSLNLDVQQRNLQHAMRAVPAQGRCSLGLLSVDPMHFVGDESKDSPHAGRYHSPLRVLGARCPLPPCNVRDAGMSSTHVLKNMPFTSLEHRNEVSQSHPGTKQK